MNPSLLNILSREPVFKTLPSIETENEMATELNMNPFSISDEYPTIDEEDSNVPGSIDYFHKQYYIEESCLQFLLGKNLDSHTEYSFKCFCNCTNITECSPKMQFLNLQRVYESLEKYILTYSQAIIILQSVYGMPTRIARIYVLSFFAYMYGFRCDNVYFPARPMFYLYIAEQVILKMKWRYSNGKSYFLLSSQLSAIKDKFRDPSILNELVNALLNTVVPKTEEAGSKISYFLLSLLEIGSNFNNKFIERLFGDVIPRLRDNFENIQIDVVFSEIKNFIQNKFGTVAYSSWNAFSSIIIIPIKAFLGVQTHENETISIYFSNCPTISHISNQSY